MGWRRNIRCGCAVRPLPHQVLWCHPVPPPTEEVAHMPPLRTPPTHRRRALVAALLVLAAACGAPAPEPGLPHTSTSSAITVYTLAESGAGQPGQISHGKP